MINAYKIALNPPPIFVTSFKIFVLTSEESFFILY